MKKKSALFVSLAMVLVAVLALTTASFAWFTSSLNPTVSSIDIGVTTSNALLISADANKDFATSLDAAALKTADNKANNFLPDFDGTNALTGENIRKEKTATLKKGFSATDMGFVTAIDGAKWSTTYDANNYTAVAGTGTHTGQLSNSVSGDEAKNMYFVKFDLFFRASLVLTDTQYVDVSLDLTSNDGASPNPVYTGSKVVAKNAATGTLQNEIPKIVRVAFVTGADSTTADVVNPDTYKIWAPNMNGVDGLTGTIAYDKSADMQYTIAAKNYGDSAVFTGTAVAGGNNSAATTDLTLFKMKTDRTHKVTVYIWLEGNDAEADNVVAGGEFSTLLSFKGTVVTPSVT